MMAVCSKLSSRELFFHKNVQRSGKGLQMMTYSVGSSNSYPCMHDVMSICMLNGKASTTSCSHKFSVLRSEFCLLFRARVKSLKFYDVPIGYVKEEARFRCELELFKARDANSIRLKCPGTSRGRLQLT